MKESREFFKSTGEPEERERTREREELAKRRFVEGGEKNPELERILQGIDFVEMERIFKNIAARSGINTETMSFITPEGIEHGSAGWSAVAAYDKEGNLITLSYEKIKEVADALGLDTELAVIKVLCHEETHATSKIECYGLGTTLLDPQFRRDEKEGYGRYRRGRNYEEFLFYLFDEGVTEKLAREVFIEYARATGIAHTEAFTKFMQVLKEKPTQMSYAVPVEFVEAFIKKISDISKTSKDAVWRAVVRGQREGVELLSEQMQEVLKEVVPPEFLEKLAHAHSDEDLENLMREFLSPKTETPSLRGKVLSWLKKVGSVKR